MKKIPLKIKILLCLILKKISQNDYPLKNGGTRSSYIEVHAPPLSRDWPILSKEIKRKKRNTS